MSDRSTRKEILDFLLTQMLACGMDGDTMNDKTRGALNAFAHTTRHLTGPAPTDWLVGNEITGSDHPVAMIESFARDLGPAVRHTWDGGAYDYRAARRMFELRIQKILVPARPHE